MRRVSQHTARTGAHDRGTARPAAAFRSTTSREPRSSYRSLAATSEPPVTETERYRALLGPIAMIFGALAMVAFQFSAGFPWILIALGVAFAIPAYSRGVRPRGASALSRGLTIIGFAILLVAIIIMLTGTGTRAGSGRGADGPIIPVHHVPASGPPLTLTGHGDETLPVATGSLAVVTVEPATARDTVRVSTLLDDGTAGAEIVVSTGLSERGVLTGGRFAPNNGLIVEADGEWTITIAPWTELPTYKLGATIVGEGDADETEMFAFEGLGGMGTFTFDAPEGDALHQELYPSEMTITIHSTDRTRTIDGVSLMDTRMLWPMRPLVVTVTSNVPWRLEIAPSP